MGMEIEHASAKIRDKHIADDEEDYAGVPAWSALYPVRQVIGAASECERQLPGLARPEGMADFMHDCRVVPKPRRGDACASAAPGWTDRRGIWNQRDEDIRRQQVAMLLDERLQAG